MGLKRSPWVLVLPFVAAAAQAEETTKPADAPAAAPAPASPSPAAGAAATVSPMPASLDIKVSVGDAWTYDVRDDVTGEARETVEFAVTRIADGDIETRVSQTKSANPTKKTGVEIFDSRWRLKDNGNAVFRPYSGLAGAPEALQIGKSWAINFHASRKGAGGAQDVAGTGTLVAWERVTLPSGAAYDAFKTDLRTSVTLPNGRKRETHSIQWFAPAVNRVVKRIDENRVNGKLLDATQQTLRTYKPAAKT